MEKLGKFNMVPSRCAAFLAFSAACLLAMASCRDKAEDNAASVADAPPAVNEQQPVTKVSRIVNQWGTFELRLQARLEGGDDGFPPSTHCEYAVFLDGKRLGPPCQGGEALVGCHYVPPEEVRLAKVGDAEDGAGWLLGVGGICGNTFSWRWRLIRPRRTLGVWEYETATFLAKEPPVVRRTGDAFEAWSLYQEWGKTGTATSFFVPQRRVVIRDPEQGRGIRLAPLPAEPGDWPDLEWRTPVGDFVAGVAQLNPELMEIAAEGFGEEDWAVLKAQGLPTDPAGIAELVGQVRAAQRLGEKAGHFRLDWSEYAGRGK